MKPITHPLAVAVVEAAAAWQSAPYDGNEAPRIAYDQAEAEWRVAGCPLYAGPIPMPAPALGMRVWYTRNTGASQFVDSFDIRSVGPSPSWEHRIMYGDTIDLITDYRTGDVLWRRS